MAENTNINQTVEAWADILIKNWQYKLNALEIGQTGSLYDSFHFEIISNGLTDDTPGLVELYFNYYGRFVDMGVGKGIELADVNKTKRKSKAWYSKELYIQVNRLSELLAEKYGIKTSRLISEHINDYNPTTVGV